MSKGKLAVLALIVALVAAFFVFDLKQYFSIEYFSRSARRSTPTTPPTLPRPRRSSSRST